MKGGKDLDHEFFSPRTDTKPTWFREHPVIFHHGKAELGDELVGTEGEIEQKDDGWWAPLWLERQSRYFEMLDALIRAGKMYGSSGSMSHLVDIDRKSGEILVWPHVEQTLTMTPANIYSRITANKALDDFTSAGIEVAPEIRDLLTEPDSTADLGSDLPEGGEDPAMAKLATTLNQLDEVLNSLAR